MLCSPRRKQGWLLGVEGAQSYVSVTKSLGNRARVRVGSRNRITRK